MYVNVGPRRIGNRQKDVPTLLRTHRVIVYTYTVSQKKQDNRRHHYYRTSAKVSLSDEDP